jgi:hypothetical protein
MGSVFKAFVKGFATVFVAKTVYYKLRDMNKK